MDYLCDEISIIGDEKLHSNYYVVRLPVRGDGWLRILEFMPDGKNRKHLAHRTGACDQFEMVVVF